MNLVALLLAIPPSQLDGKSLQFSWQGSRFRLSVESRHVGDESLFMKVSKPGKHAGVTLVDDGPPIEAVHVFGKKRLEVLILSERNLYWFRYNPGELSPTRMESPWGGDSQIVEASSKSVVIRSSSLHIPARGYYTFNPATDAWLKSKNRPSKVGASGLFYKRLLAK